MSTIWRRISWKLGNPLIFSVFPQLSQFFLHFLSFSTNFLFIFTFPFFPRDFPLLPALKFRWVQFGRESVENWETLQFNSPWQRIQFLKENFPAPVVSEQFEMSGNYNFLFSSYHHPTMVPQPVISSVNHGQHMIKSSHLLWQESHPANCYVG